MKIKMNLSDLLVSDTPRKKSQEYFRINGIDAIDDLPEVWNSNIGNIISDGNNRAYFLAEKGESKIAVNYRGDLPIFAYTHTNIVDDAQKLKNSGINSAYDLVKKIIPK